MVRQDNDDCSREVGMLTTTEERRGSCQTSNKRYYYCTYGLRIESQLELPELLEISPCDDPDVVILAPGVESELEGATYRNGWLEMGHERCQITIEGIARYRVEAGQRILLDRRVPRETDSAADPGDVRLFLLGGALGALLHQRQWLPLHVSALLTPGGVWAFTGHSGAGKSTLGAWLHRTQGWPMVTDDVAVIKPHEETPYLHPGPPRVKLWKDALSALGIHTEGLVRDLSRADKYHMMFKEGFQDSAHPMKALVILERCNEGEASSLERIKGVAAFSAIMASLYRPEVAEEFNVAAGLMQSAVSLSRKIRVYRYRRPWALEHINQNLTPLLDEIETCREW